METNKIIKKARVTVAGLGGLGSNIAVMLTRAGVGTLHLIDFDKVDESNLSRQHYFISDLGINKTEALKKQLLQINPLVKIITTNEKIFENNCEEVFKNEKIVCEAFDNPESKALLVNYLLENKPDTYVISASGLAGYGKSNEIVTKRITDKFYICGDGVSGIGNEVKLIAPRACLCAAHQANAVLRIILGKYEV